MTCHIDLSLGLKSFSYFLHLDLKQTNVPKFTMEDSFRPIGSIVHRFLTSKKNEWPILANIGLHVIKTTVSSSIIERCFGTVSGVLTKARSQTCAKNLLFFV